MQIRLSPRLVPDKAASVRVRPLRRVDVSVRSGMPAAESRLSPSGHLCSFC
jgi:hypothetical protein